MGQPQYRFGTGGLATRSENGKTVPRGLKPEFLLGFYAGLEALLHPKAQFGVWGYSASHPSADGAGARVGHLWSVLWSAGNMWATSHAIHDYGLDGAGRNVHV